MSVVISIDPNPRKVEVLPNSVISQKVVKSFTDRHPYFRVTMFALGTLASFAAGYYFFFQPARPFAFPSEELSLEGRVELLKRLSNLCKESAIGHKGLQAGDLVEATAGLEYGHTVTCYLKLTGDAYKKFVEGGILYRNFESLLGSISAFSEKFQKFLKPYEFSSALMERSRIIHFKTYPCGRN
jgi:hypothetical protein